MNRAGIISTYAGNGTLAYSGDGGPATSASLSNPRSVALDSRGNLYIDDSGNHSVRRGESEGDHHDGRRGTCWGDIVRERCAGDDGAPRLPHCGRHRQGTQRLYRRRDPGLEGEPGWDHHDDSRQGHGGCVADSRDDLPARSRRRHEGQRVIVDGQGLVSQSLDGRILKLSPSGALTTVAGGGKSYAEGVRATRARIHQPLAIAVDGKGNVYYSEDENNDRLVPEMYPKLQMAGVDGTVWTIGGVRDNRARNGFALHSVIGGAGLAFDNKGNLYAVGGFVQKLHQQPPKPGTGG